MPSTVLRWFLRLIGTASLLAILFVPAPYACMNSIHRLLGMGVLPDAPVVGYLARSTSAFYALLGGLLWLVSFDLARYRPILWYLGAVFILFGLSLAAIDSIEGLPLFWRVGEGPIDTAFGVIILWLNYRAQDRISESARS
jgi:hypothetical protein